MIGDQTPADIKNLTIAKKKIIQCLGTDQFILTNSNNEIFHFAVSPNYLPWDKLVQNRNSLPNGLSITNGAVGIILKGSISNILSAISLAGVKKQ